MQDAIQTEETVSSEESSWEAFSEDEESDVQLSSEESDYEDSGDEEIFTRRRKSSALPQYRSHGWDFRPPGSIQSLAFHHAGDNGEQPDRR